MNERWRGVAEYPNYEVSDRGRVRSVERTITCADGSIRHYRSRVLRPFHDQAGYLRVSLGQRAIKRIHRLVAEAFCERPPTPGLEVRHYDGDNRNNVAENLVWGTPSENQFDRVRHGRNHNANKTQCKRKHDDFYAILMPSGRYRRRCRTCDNARRANRRIKQLEGINA